MRRETTVDSDREGRQRGSRLSRSFVASAVQTLPVIASEAKRSSRPTCDAPRRCVARAFSRHCARSISLDEILRGFAAQNDRAGAVIASEAKQSRIPEIASGASHPRNDNPYLSLRAKRSNPVGPRATHLGGASHVPFHAIVREASRLTRFFGALRASLGTIHELSLRALRTLAMTNHQEPLRSSTSHPTPRTAPRPPGTSQSLSCHGRTGARSRRCRRHAVPATNRRAS